MYRRVVRPLLFRRDPELAHEQALALAAMLGRSRIARELLEAWFVVEDRRLRQTLFGLEFPNPVGLAAGYDKNAVAVSLWPALGFGFVEIGSVTARPQPGNERPRLFRVPEQGALVNRMGLNNDGAEAIAARVPPAPHRVPIGVNVGKSRQVSLAGAAADYASAMEKFRGRADFFVLNISSPNTPGLRRLQERELLAGLLTALRPERPVLLKISPDLSHGEIDEVIGLAQQHGVAGIVATNTTVNHSNLPEGGLSGAPLRGHSTECVRHIWRQTRGTLPVIGVGGVFTAADAYEKIRAGARLVEVWTGMVYEGPGMAARINRGLLRLLERDGFGSVAEAVGGG